jgi:hypothetical protein
MKFAFIAKHRGIWQAEWLCGALGVSRGKRSCNIVHYAWKYVDRASEGNKYPRAFASKKR